MTVTLPEALVSRIRKLTGADHGAVERFVTSAIVEKVTQMLPDASPAARAERGSRAKFDAALAQVPCTEPDRADRL